MLQIAKIRQHNSNQILMPRFGIADPFEDKRNRAVTSLKTALPNEHSAKILNSSGYKQDITLVVEKKATEETINALLQTGGNIQRKEGNWLTYVFETTPFTILVSDTEQYQVTC